MYPSNKTEGGTTPSPQPATKPIVPSGRLLDPSKRSATAPGPSTPRYAPYRRAKSPPDQSPPATPQQKPQSLTQYHFAMAPHSTEPDHVTNCSPRIGDRSYEDTQSDLAYIGAHFTLPTTIPQAIEDADLAEDHDVADCVDAQSLPRLQSPLECLAIEGCGPLSTETLAPTESSHTLVGQADTLTGAACGDDIDARSTVDKDEDTVCDLAEKGIMFLPRVVAVRVWRAAERA